MRVLVAFVVGVVFSIGLGISGMTLPSKVIGFLDVTGAWDPSLAFVMAGAVSVYFVAFRFVRGATPVFADRFQLPVAKQLDRRLLIGAALFGIGWGLGGYCPGPALTSVGAASAGAVIFVAAMIGGMLVFRVVVPSRRLGDG